MSALTPVPPLTSSSQLVRDNGVQPWLGTVALDSAAYNVEAIMRTRHFGLYDQAFGTPRVLARGLAGRPGRRPHPPLLAVCSSQRATSCDQAQAYVQQTTGFRNRAQAQLENRSHREINAQLGLPGAYTDAVERFMKRLAPHVGSLLEH